MEGVRNNRKTKKCEREHIDSDKEDKEEKWLIIILINVFFSD